MHFLERFVDRVKNTLSVSVTFLNNRNTNLATQISLKSSYETTVFYSNLNED